MTYAAAACPEGRLADSYALIAANHNDIASAWNFCKGQLDLLPPVLYASFQTAATCPAAPSHSRTTSRRSTATVT